LIRRGGVIMEEGLAPLLNTPELKGRVGAPLKHPQTVNIKVGEVNEQSTLDGTIFGHSFIRVECGYDIRREVVLARG